MVQNKVIQVDVAFLTYDSKRCSDSPLVKQDNSCVFGLFELKKHREIKRRDKESMGEFFFCINLNLKRESELFS